MAVLTIWSEDFSSGLSKNPFRDHLSLRILIFSKTFHEHLVHIQKLVDALYTEGFGLNSAKCSFASSHIQYLGHILTPNSVEPLPDNISAITKFSVPTSHCTILWFHGKVNLYRKFIPLIIIGRGNIYLGIP